MSGIESCKKQSEAMKLNVLDRGNLLYRHTKWCKSLASKLDRFFALLSASKHKETESTTIDLRVLDAE